MQAARRARREELLAAIEGMETARVADTLAAAPAPGEAAAAARARAARRAGRDLQRAESDLDSTVRSLRFVDDRLRALRAAPETCPICMEHETRCISVCGHLLCAGCTESVFDVGGREPPCPVCRRSLQRGDVYRITAPSSTSPRLGLGSKLRAAADFIEACVAADKKVVVCCQWKAPMARLLAHLAQHGTRGYQLEGNTSQRAHTLRRFVADGEPAALFLSLERSSAGINLVCASRVVLLRAVTGSVEEAATIESQAIGRVARSGQTVRVHVHHFVYGGVEEVLWHARHPAARG